MNDEEWRVLILGDGNFSFSLALAQLLWPLHPSAPSADTVARAYLSVPDCIDNDRITILTTSFDDRSQLLAKYPESKDIIAKLEVARFRDRIHIVHGINAWELPTHFSPIAEAPGASSKADWRSGNRRDGSVGFDTIAWNHPHLGTEDYRLHRFLMAHFFRSVSEVLRKPDATQQTYESTVVVSLVRGQETRWNIVGEAARSDLVLDSETSPFIFEEDDWDGYIVKRNKHGRSFKNEATKRRHRDLDMKSHGFRFVFSNSKRLCPSLDKLPQEEFEASSSPNILQTVHSLVKPASFNIPESMVQSSFSDLETTSALVQLNPATKSDNQEKTLRLSKKQLRQIAPPSLTCPYCEKKLSSARAYSQHVHQIHVLKQRGDDWVPNAPRNIACDVNGCRKMFASDDAAWQHRINRHGVLNATDLPSIINSTESQDSKNFNPAVVIDSEYDFIPCDVCGQAVQRGKWGSRMHLETLKPAVGLDMRCPLCSATFIESRALSQHFKFCRLTKA